MPVIRHKAQRVGVLIDVANLYHSAKNLYQRRVNFGAVLKEAVAGRQLVRAYAYVVKTEGGEEQTFFDVLEKLGIETRVKDLQVFYGGAKKGDWDVGIAIDAVRIAKLVDVIVLMSGDGDFVPLIDYLRNQGTQIEVMSFGKSTSSHLKEEADEFFDMCESPEQFLLRQTARSRNLPKNTASNN